MEQKYGNDMAGIMKIIF